MPRLWLEGERAALPHGVPRRVEEAKVSAWAGVAMLALVFTFAGFMAWLGRED